MTALPNNLSGVSFWGGASFNTVGGQMSGERNIISGNGGAGVWIGQQNTEQNKVSGNFIGLNVNGTDTIPNGDFGVVLIDNRYRLWLLVREVVQREQQ